MWNDVLDPRDIGRLAEEGSREDRARFAGMSPEERLELFLELCALADEIVRGRPDADALRAPTPRSAESEALWERLMRRERRVRP
jgi:hypothetical protein